jgi:hypothetical protein
VASKKSRFQGTKAAIEEQRSHYAGDSDEEETKDERRNGWNDRFGSVAEGKSGAKNVQGFSIRKDVLR